MLLSCVCRSPYVQSLQSGEICSIAAVSDHMPFFNFTKMLVGFSENIFCGNSKLETLLTVLKWSPARVDLLGVVLCTGGSGYKGLSVLHLRASTSWDFCLKLSLCGVAFCFSNVIFFHKRLSLYLSLHFPQWILVW
jgi:hypothetical protein